MPEQATDHAKPGTKPAPQRAGNPNTPATDTPTNHTNSQSSSSAPALDDARAVTLALAEQPKAVRFRILRAAHPEWSVRRCAKAAGYSPKTPARDILAVAEGQAAARTIDSQRTILQMSPETSLTGIASRLAGIATATIGKGKNRTYANEPRDRIRADKELAAMLDYQPDKRIKVESRSLIVELAELSLDELRAVAGPDAQS